MLPTVVGWTLFVADKSCWELRCGQSLIFSAWNRSALSVYGHWRIQDFRLRGQVERRRREYRGAAGAERVAFGEGCLGRGLCPPINVWDFFASEWCILRAFWYMIRQFTTSVLIRWKLAKSSYIVTKPCKVIRLCFSGICLCFVSRIRLPRKSYERILMKFSGAVGCIPGKKWLDFGTNYHNYRQESQQCKKKWGIGGGLHCLNASNVPPLGAMFHSDNLVETE